LLQRSRDHVFHRSLSHFRVGRRRRVRDRGRGPGTARRSAFERPRRPRAPHGRCAGERRVRYLRFPGPADRPRRALAAHHVLAAFARLAREDRADRDQRAPAPDPDAGALLEARAGGAPRRALLSRGSESGHRRHGGSIAPDERGARRFQQREMGQEVPRSDRARPEETRCDAPRGLYQAGRHRRGGGDHVAGDARGALAAREENPPELLPADDHRDGGGAVRGARRETCADERTFRAQETPKRRTRIGLGPCHSEPSEESAFAMNPQLKGVENLEGTYLFDLATSAKALRLNRFLHGFTVAANRTLFKDDPEGAFDKARLSAEERRMVRELDWAALMRYGASFFCLEKLGRVKGVSNPEMVAGFRGESLEEFLKTRNVPGAR